MQKSVPASEHNRTLVTWGPLSAVLVTLGVYFLAQVGSVMLLSVYPVLLGWSQSQTSLWFEQSVLAQFLLVAATEGLTLWFIYSFLKSRHTGFRALGLKWPVLRDIGYAIVGYGVYFIGYYIALQFILTYLPSIDLDQKQEIGFNASNAAQQLWLVFLSLVILPPIVEEIVARGFLYTGLRSRLSVVPSAIITSVLFAVAHLQFGSGSALLWIAGIDTFILSLVLVYLREKTDSLASPILLHMTKNGVAFAALFIFKVG